MAASGKRFFIIIPAVKNNRNLVTSFSANGLRLNRVIGPLNEKD